MKIATFEIILETAIDCIRQHLANERDTDDEEAAKEADRLWDILLDQKAKGKKTVGFKFER